MHAKSCPHTLAESTDSIADAWATALRLIGEGASRRAAAKIVGMNAMTLWNRLERYRTAHNLPPLPDARRGPRAKVSRASDRVSA